MTPPAPPPLELPRALRWLLRLVHGAGGAEVLLGDLAESLADRLGTRRRLTMADRRWLWREAAASLTPAAIHAIRQPRPGGLTLGRGRLMDLLWSDVRYGLRSIVRRPVFTLLACVTIAVGIAATTVVYSAVDGLVLRPFPFPQADRLVGVGTSYPKLGGELGFWENLSPAEYLDFTRSKSLGRVVAWDMGNRQVTVGETTENLFSAFWWGDAFATLGVRPHLGRGLNPEEIRRSERVAVLSFRVWRNRFGADTALVGQRILVNGDPYVVVGIMPPRALIYGTDLWIPMPVGPDIIPRNARQFQVLARLAPGATLGQANAELEVIARQVEQEHVTALREYQGWRAVARTWTDINVRQLKPAAAVMLGAVGFVMLLVCTNVATLLLGRSSGRARELAMRTALGAGRARLLRQMLVESLLLAGAGAFAGVALGELGVSALKRALESLALPIAGDVALNARVLTLTAIVAGVAGLAFGSLPALHALRFDVQRTLQTDSGAVTTHGSRLRLQRILVGVEAALALTLLAGGGYLLRSFARLREVDPGFSPNGLLTMRLSLARERYPRERVEPFFATLRERVAAVPGVRAVATTSQFPPQVFGRREFRIEGVPPAAEPDKPVAYATLASPGYFEALGIPIRAGRSLTPNDRVGAPPAVIINEAAAARYFPNGDPVGRRIQVGDPTAPWFEIVGVVGNTRNRGLDRDPAPEMFISTLQADGWDNQLFLVVRTAAEPRMALPSIRQVVREIDPDQPVYAVSTVEESFDNSQLRRRLSTLVLTLFGGFALILAAVGVYGVVSYAASQRTREVGVRMALGASRKQVSRLFVRQAMIPMIIGAAAGTAAAAGIGRLMASLLFEVRPGDPLTLAGAAVLLGAIGLLAAYLPARRASRLDPVRALKSE